MRHPSHYDLTRSLLPLIGVVCAAAILVLAAIVLLDRPKTVHATPNELGYAEQQYPFIVGTKLDSCTLCHTEVGSYLFNPYGQAYNDQLGSAPERFQAIENLDSDGDGSTNIQELKAGTSPGDPNDHPVSARPPQEVFLPLVEISSR